MQLLRQCDLSIRLADKEHRPTHAHINNNNDYSTDQSGSSKSSSKRDYHKANQLSEEILKRLRLKGKCFRCQQPSHINIDLDAPCRGRREGEITILE